MVFCIKQRCKKNNQVALIIVPASNTGVEMHRKLLANILIGFVEKSLLILFFPQGFHKYLKCGLALEGGSGGNRETSF